MTPVRTTRTLILILTASVLMVVARWMLDPVLEDALPFSLGYGAVALAALVAGWRAAAGTALVLFAVLYVLFIARGQAVMFEGHDLVRTVVYAAVCGIIIGAVESMRRAQRRSAFAAARARRLQHKSEAQARRTVLLTDSLPVLISYVDAAARYQFNNKGYEEWFGIRPEQIKGRHMREVLGDAAFERVRPRVEAALAGVPQHFEDEIPYTPGGARAVAADYVPDRRADGTVAGFYALVSDISERRRAEARLKESEERFRVLADSSPAMIWVHGPKGSAAREFVNREYLHFLGASPQQVLGEGWRDYFHEQDLPAYLATFDDAVARRVAFDQEARVRRHDGEWRWVRTVARPRFSPLGEYLGHAGLAVDTTELRHAQRQLIESERLAAVGTLAAGLSHDMSNLIMPLNEALRDLERAPLDDDGRAVLTAAQRSADALKDLVRAVRRLVRNDGPGACAVIDLREWWARNGPLLRATIPRRVRLAADLGEQPLPVACIETDLTRAVLNLLVNAAEAMEEGGTREPAVQVRGRRLGGEGGRVELTVSDNGPGIPPGLRARVFEPFFSTKKGHSTGMGLSIVRGFAESCGGSVALDSGAGRGTTFTLSLPAAGAVPGPIAPPRHTGERRAWFARGSEPGTSRPLRSGDPHTPGTP